MTLTQSTTFTEFFCPECGYNLTGISSQRCPECGHELDWASLQHSRIPWIYRKEIGAFRAYWRTVWLTMLDSRFISDDVRRPVSLDDALRFRRITVLLAFIPLAVGELALFLSFYGTFTHWSSEAWRSGGVLRLAFIMDWAFLPVAWISLYLFLKAATGMQSWFFHPRELPVVRQNRSVALSYYGCAPLAWTPLTLAALVLCILIGSLMVQIRIPTIIYALMWIVGVGLFVLQTVGWWLNLIRLVRRTTQCSNARVFALAAGMPAFWFITLCTIALGIPAIYVFICLFILSLL